MNYILSFLTASFITSVLLYMHKIDPTYSLYIPFFLFPLDWEAMIYFSIISSAAIIENNRYKIPDFLIVLSMFPIFYDTRAALLSGFIYFVPIFLIYIAVDLFNKRLLTAGDIKLLFSIGLFFRDREHLVPFYLLLLVFLIPYSQLKSKIVPIGPPAVLAAYISYILVR